MAEGSVVGFAEGSEVGLLVGSFVGPRFPFGSAYYGAKWIQDKKGRQGRESRGKLACWPPEGSFLLWWARAAVV